VAVSKDKSGSRSLNDGDKVVAAAVARDRVAQCSGVSAADAQGHALASALCSSRGALWEVARASCATPGYFSEHKVADHHIIDGVRIAVRAHVAPALLTLHVLQAVLCGSPIYTAVLEAERLWPGRRLDCVVSIGVGEFSQSAPDTVTFSGKLIRTAASAAEQFKEVQDALVLFPDSVRPQLFRFSAEKVGDFSMSEWSAETLDTMEMRAQRYLETTAGQALGTLVSEYLRPSRAPASS
jgi:hypothetical protein